VKNNFIVLCLWRPQNVDWGAHPVPGSPVGQPWFRVFKRYKFQLGFKRFCKKGSIRIYFCWFSYLCECW